MPRSAIARSEPSQHDIEIACRLGIVSVEREPPLHLGLRLLVDGDGLGVFSNALPDRVDQRQELIDGKAQDRIVRSSSQDIHPAPAQCPQRRTGSLCVGMGSRRPRNLATAANWVEESGRRQIAPKSVRRGRTEGRRRVKSTDLAEVRKALWATADQMRANSSLGPAEYRGPVLGLIFLAYAEHRFDLVTPELEEKASKYNPVTPDHYKARSVLYVPDEARLSNLVTLPEGENRGKAVDEAMKAIEAANPELKDVLPRGYQRMEQSVLIELCRLFAPLPRQLSGDAFGLIYEDFLSNFAMAEGRLGGEFFTPYSIVRLIVEIIEPFQGRVFDPACGSGGMFVQCAKFVERHNESATEELSVYGQALSVRVR